MNKEKKIIPELRFPEFKNAKPWAEAPLNELAEKVVLRNTGSSITKVFTNSAIDGIVDQREYFDRDIADKNNLDNYYVVDPDDYVYNPRISVVAPVGPVSKNKLNETGAMSPLYTVFRFKEKENSFYEYYFKSRHWYKSIRKVANTGARFDRMSITDSAFMDIPILYPEPKEQQKIASFLSSLDELIEANNQKLKVLKDYKKGLTENLFPQEGQLVPNYRFSEFNNANKWTKVKVKELIQQHSEKSTCNNQYPVLTSSRDGIMFQTDYYNDRNVASKDNTGYNVVPRGYFTYRHMSDDLIFKFNINTICDRGIVSTLYPVFSAIEEKINPFFLQQVLNEGCEFRDFAISQRQGGSRTYMYLSKLNELEIAIPSLLEQKKITSCLSSIDEIIFAQKEKIEQLMEYEKGLLQSLFPKIND